MTDFVSDGTSGGTITMAPDGTYTYTPPTDFCGSDTFTYRVADSGELADTATSTDGIAIVRRNLRRASASLS